jgi:hypothetical protein
MKNIKDASRQAVENVLTVAIENFYKSGVVDMLLSWHNAKSEDIKAYNDIFLTNDDENVDILLSGKTPSEILRYTSRNYEHYDYFVGIDAYGYLISFHYDYFIDTYIKGDHDLIDYIMENVSVKDLDKLHALSLKDKNEILKEALLNE